MAVEHKDANEIRGMTINSRQSYADSIGNAWAEEMKKPISFVNEELVRSRPGPPSLPPPPRSPMWVPNASKDAKGKMVLNEEWNNWAATTYVSRLNWVQSLIDPRRDIDGECGYPNFVTPRQYRYMHDREGIANRVDCVYPDECWAVTPQVFETERLVVNTPFEKKWLELCRSDENNPIHFMHRVDILSGIGRYGVLLIGTDDENARDLAQPVPGVDPKAPKRTRDYNLLFLRPFDELYAHIVALDRDPASPRFGKPIYYNIIFGDPNAGASTVSGASLSSRIVHWSRVIHVADNRESSAVFGVPRQQPVFNRLCDCRKILGGSPEMFWKGGFPGISFELNPELVTSGPNLDMASIKAEMDAYQNNLQRYIAIVGMQAKSLAPQVADPTGHFMIQMQAIALSIGVPLRIFMGSEQAQLASGQDVRTWNRRLGRREERYLSPMLVRPVVNRFVLLGVMPSPANGQNAYFAEWPDINIPSEQEQGQISDHQAAALMKYIIGSGWQVVPPLEFLTIILRLPEERAKVVWEAAKKWAKTPDFEIKNPNEKALKDPNTPDSQRGSSLGM